MTTKTYKKALEYTLEKLWLLPKEFADRIRNIK